MQPTVQRKRSPLTLWLLLNHWHLRQRHFCLRRVSPASIEAGEYGSRNSITFVRGDWMNSQFKFPTLPLCLSARGGIASPLYVPNRTKENDEAACKQNDECKSIACHFRT